VIVVARNVLSACFTISAERREVNWIVSVKRRKIASSRARGRSLSAPITT
jgi:hypothetical protein